VQVLDEHSNMRAKALEALISDKMSEIIPLIDELRQVIPYALDPNRISVITLASATLRGQTQ
jgi:hypothetical protein